MTATNDLGRVLDRLDRLERQNKRLWRGLLAAVAGLVVVGGVAARGAAEKVVEATEFVLKDAQGTVRWRVAYDAKDGVVETLSDAKGNGRIKLYVDPDGNARVRLYDDEGSPRVGAVTFSTAHAEKDVAGRAAIGVMGYGNKDGTGAKGGIFTTTFKDGTAEHSVFDKNGVLRLQAAADPERVATFGAYGSKDDNKAAVQLGTMPDGSAFQQWFGHKGNRQVVVGTSPNGSAGVYLMDTDGKDRAAFGMSPKQVVALNLLDENQKIRLQSLVVPKGTTATGIGADGYASFGVSDATGRLRSDTSTYGDGQVSTDYYDADGKLRVSNIVLASGNAFHKQLDPKGQLRMYTGTYANGESGQCVLGKTGNTKFSTSIKGDDSLSFYVEKDAATQAWEAYRNARDAVQLGQDLKNLYDLIK